MQRHLCLGFIVLLANSVDIRIFYQTAIWSYKGVRRLSDRRTLTIHFNIARFPIENCTLAWRMLGVFITKFHYFFSDHSKSSAKFNKKSANFEQKLQSSILIKFALFQSILQPSIKDTLFLRLGDDKLSQFHTLKFLPKVKVTYVTLVPRDLHFRLSFNNNCSGLMYFYCGLKSLPFMHDRWTRDLSLFF